MIRYTLDRQRIKHGETFAALSRMLRRDDRYLQRFVREGRPKRLAEREIEMLAAYFRIDPRLLGGKRVKSDDEPNHASATGGADGRRCSTRGQRALGGLRADQRRTR